MLQVWDGPNEMWMDAIETCPEEDRYRQDLDMANKLFFVNVCHLSEFRLVGQGANIRMGADYAVDEAAGMV